HGADAVSPLFPEHQFFVDELPGDAVRGANVLEINPRSGALAIALVKAGASQVKAVESSPRARLLVGYNALLNGCADRLVLLAGGDDPFAPVQGERFDWIVADVTPQPVPAGPEVSRPAGYGLGGLERILQGLDAHLADDGRAQIVTIAPG